MKSSPCGDDFLQFFNSHLAKMQENCYYGGIQLLKEGVLR